MFPFRRLTFSLLKLQFGPLWKEKGYQIASVKKILQLEFDVLLCFVVHPGHAVIVCGVQLNYKYTGISCDISTSQWLLIHSILCITLKQIQFQENHILYFDGNHKREYVSASEKV